MAEHRGSIIHLERTDANVWVIRIDTDNGVYEGKVGNGGDTLMSSPLADVLIHAQDRTTVGATINTDQLDNSGATVVTDGDDDPTRMMIDRSTESSIQEAMDNAETRENQSQDAPARADAKVQGYTMHSATTPVNNDYMLVGTVTSVTDGDTFDMDIQYTGSNVGNFEGESVTIRLAGVDTPEMGINDNGVFTNEYSVTESQALTVAEEAKTFSTSLLEENDGLIIADMEANEEGQYEMDDYGRAVAMVYKTSVTGSHQAAMSPNERHVNLNETLIGNESQYVSGVPLAMVSSDSQYYSRFDTGFWEQNVAFGHEERQDEVQSYLEDAEEQAQEEEAQAMEDIREDNGRTMIDQEQQEAGGRNMEEIAEDAGISEDKLARENGMSVEELDEALRNDPDMTVDVPIIVDAPSVRPTQPGQDSISDGIEPETTTNVNDFFRPVERPESSRSPFHLRIGDVEMVIPPSAIQLNRQSNVKRVKTLRTNYSMATNTGSGVNQIQIHAYFHNLESINGREELLDSGYMNYMDGLRPMIAQFKTAPFMPVENELINETWDIHNVALKNISTSLIAGFPNALMATITLEEFDHQAYMPHEPFLDNCINYPLLRWYYQRLLNPGEIEKYGVNQLLPISRNGMTGDVTFQVADENTLFERRDAIQQLRYMDTEEEAEKKYEEGEGVRGSMASDARSVLEARAQHQRWQDIKAEYGEDAIPRTMDNNEPTIDLGGVFTEVSGHELFKELYGQYGIESVKAVLNEGYAGTEELAFGMYMPDLTTPQLLHIPRDSDNMVILNLKFDMNASLFSSSEQFADNMGVNNGTVVMVEPSDPRLDQIANREDDAENELDAYRVKYRKLRQLADMTESDLPLLDWDIEDLNINSFTVMYENHFSSAQVMNLENPSLQYLGSQDPYIQLTMQTTNQYSVEQIKQLFSEADRLSREYRFAITSGFIGVRNELSDLYGIRTVLPDSVTVRTLEQQPGTFEIDMVLVGFDKTQRRSEALEGINAIEDSETPEKEDRFASENPNAKDAVVLDRKMRNLEIYPDLNLPTYQKLNDSIAKGNLPGVGIERYHNPNGARFVDPDFYISSSWTMRQYIKEELDKARDESGTGPTLRLRDWAGGAGQTSVKNGESGGESFHPDGEKENNESEMQEIENENEPNRVYIPEPSEEDVNRTENFFEKMFGSLMGTNEAEAGTSDGDFSMEDGIGSMAEKYESGGAGPGTIADNAGDIGGASYGTYQIATNTGTMKSYLSFIKSNYPSISTALSGKNPGNSGFNKAWKQLAKDQEDNFLQSQRDFIAQSHYKPFVKNVQSDTGLDVTSAHRAIKEVAWSVSVQHGAGNNVFKNALSGKNPDSMGTEDIINAVYDERSASNGNKYFGKSSASIRKGVMNRFKNERQDALDIAAQADTATASANSQQNDDPGASAPDGSEDDDGGFWGGVKDVAGDAANFVTGTQTADASDGGGNNDGGVENDQQDEDGNWLSNAYSTVGDFLAGNDMEEGSFAAFLQGEDFTTKGPAGDFVESGGAIENFLPDSSSEDFNLDMPWGDFVAQGGLAGKVIPGYNGGGAAEEKNIQEEAKAYGKRIGEIRTQQATADMLIDMAEYDQHGRMIRAFPTFQMFIVDEGKWMSSYKLWDNLYGFNALQSMDIHRSRKTAADTAVVSMTNMYSNLTSRDLQTNYGDWNYSFWSELILNEPSDELLKQREDFVDGMMLQTGARLHLRMGYGSDVTSLPVVFNGTITEMDVTDVVTIVGQGDGLELTNIISADENDSNRESFGMSVQEPSDVLAELLISKGNWFQDALSNTTNGIIGKEHPLGIQHFGVPMVSPASTVNVYDEVSDEPLEALQNIYTIDGVNLYSQHIMLNEDGENTGDIDPQTDDEAEAAADGFQEGYAEGVEEATTGEDSGGFSFPSLTGIIWGDPQKIEMELYGQTVWSVAQTMAYCLPDFIAAVHPYEMRSTLFFGKPYWYLAYRYKSEYEYDEEWNAWRRKITGEHRKPYMQFHMYGSDGDIIQNQIKASEENIVTNGIGIYGDGQQTSLVQVDSDIRYDKQRTEIVETPILSREISLLGRSTMTVGKQTETYVASTLRDYMKDMYKGNMVILGDPTLKPYDMAYISDSVHDMTGNVFIEDVTHHFSLQTGFITNFTPDLIAFNDDTLLLNQSLSLSSLAMDAVAFYSGKKIMSRLIRKMAGSASAAKLLAAGKTSSRFLAKMSTYLPSSDPDMREFRQAAREFIEADKISNEADRDAAKQKAQKKMNQLENKVKAKPLPNAKSQGRMARAGNVIARSSRTLMQSMTKFASGAGGQTARAALIRSGAMLFGGPVGLVVGTAATSILTDTIGELYNRRRGNMEAVLMAPLMYHGRNFTAGINGHRGSVYGDEPGRWDYFFLGAGVGGEGGWTEPLMDAVNFFMDDGFTENYMQQRTNFNDLTKLENNM